ncbi:NHL repeat protein [compost metagenome]
MSGIVVTPSGNLIFADYNNDRIRMMPKVDGTYYGISMTANHIYSVPFGSYYAMGIAGDSSGNVFVAEPYSNLIRKIAPDGTKTVVVGTGEVGFSGDGGPATSAEVYYPTNVAVDASGNLFITDLGNTALRKGVAQY